MAFERILSKKDIAALKSQIAVPGTDAYKSLDGISQETLDAAANLAAKMVAEYMPQQEFDEQKAALIEGLDANSTKFIERVISVAREKVETGIEEGGTI